MHSAREIQAQESGLPLNLWGGPPASGSSTPLRENIPESPTDGFPDFHQPPPTETSLPSRGRTRAGTVPSRFPGALGNGLVPLQNLTNISKSQRPTPSQTPFKSPSPSLGDVQEGGGSSTSTLLQRLRAGSLPQQPPIIPNIGGPSPFGPSIFSSWNPRSGRERATTLASIASIGSNGPSSPAQSTFSKDGMAGDNHIKTLDYLGLAETPQQSRAQLATPYIPNINDLKKASRIRSYSVNNQDKYAEDEEAYDEAELLYASYAQRAAELTNEIAATNAAIQHHNMTVQGLAAYANQSSNRPRARTVAGIMDPPSMRMLNQYYTPGAHLDPSLVPAEIRLQEEKEYEDLNPAVAALNLGRSNSQNNGMLNPEEQGLDGPTSALWLGSIPTSTTTSTLTEMFKSYGPILSARVLTHKNCGFVNFERIESAIAAKTTMNGKEIFPGAGPIRINFAKPPSASGTPGHDGIFPSPSPDPFAKGEAQGTTGAVPAGESSSLPASKTNSAPIVPPLSEMTTKILEIVKQFGATDEDRIRVSKNLDGAIGFINFTDEIPPIKETQHVRMYDAPKLRDIRKRIDNQSLSKSEIEDIAINMLNEIADLSSDYLGNTVVQKLFEHCSDEIRDAMLQEITPHLAEIGVHKNGTWAAQKIIDVCNTPDQMRMIVEHIRPYTVPLFLDQYGNYVLQGCLKFGAPYNDFIFETMLSRMWEVAQGRYGARAMRACLESHHATKNQQRTLAAAIALHSVQLATNANGALLLTWFLDTCTFPLRRTMLSPQLAPHLVHLCTHKVAYLTVLKVINQKAEPDARDTILKALFFTPKDHVLEAILSDSACGATLIFKVLTTPFFDESIRGQVVENVKAVLIRIKAQPGQGYKRLMDEVNLPTRGGNRDHSTHGERQRPGSRQTAPTGHGQHSSHFGGNSTQSQQPSSQQSQGPSQAPQQPQQQFYGQSVFESGFAGAQQREGSDTNMQPFPSFQSNAMYMNPNMMSMQYQQGMGNRGTPAGSNFFPPLQGGFNSPNDQFRGGAPSSQGPAPGMPNTSAPQFPPPGFQGVPMGMGMAGNGNSFGYGSSGGGSSSSSFMQEQANSNRRGRVSTPRANTPGTKGGSKSRSSSRY